MPRRAVSSNGRGFTIIELMVVAVIVCLASALALPLYADAIARSTRTSLVAEGKQIYDAMMAYHAEHGGFPPESVFDRKTLDPLTGEGYLKSGRAITSRLTGDELLLYLAPDLGGADQQFLIVMRLESDPSAIVAVAHTTLVDEGGEWVDGVELVTDDGLEPTHVTDR